MAAEPNDVRTIDCSGLSDPKPEPAPKPVPRNPMSDAAKARLRELSEKRKGQVFKNLNPTDVLIACDAAEERAPSVRPMVATEFEWWMMECVAKFGEKLRACFGKYYTMKGDRKDITVLAWAKFTNIGKPMEDLLAERLAHVRRDFHVTRPDWSTIGHRLRVERVVAHAYPMAIVVGLCEFLNVPQTKYVRGYTERAVSATPAPVVEDHGVTLATWPLSD